MTNRQYLEVHGSISIAELMRCDQRFSFKDRRTMLGQRFISSDQAKLLIRQGYAIVPNLPWNVDVNGFLSRMTGQQVVRLKEKSPLALHCKDKLMYPSNPYVALWPLPAKLSLNETYKSGVGYIKDQVERVPTAVELISAAYICRLVRGWTLAPGFILRSSTPGQLPDSHVCIRCDKDGIEVLSIFDNAADDRLGVAAWRVLQRRKKTQ